jgi:nickel transport protein
VSGARVTAFDPADQKIGETTTDEQGQFSLPAQFRCDYRLLLEVGDGHGAECLVHAEQLPAGLPTRGEAPHIHPHVETHSHAETPDHEQLEAIRSELAELRDQLADNEQALRLRGVLGGIGYIVGVAGIAMYLLGLRRQRS